MSYSVNLENASSLLKAGNQLKREGKLKEAIAAYYSYIEINSNSAWCYHNLGEVLAQLEDIDGAIAAYEKAIEINPLSPWSNNNLGKLFAGQGKLDKAAKFYRKAINTDPSYYGFYNNLGKVFAQKGELNKADKFYRKAIELNPKNPESYHNLGRVFQQKSNLHGAIDLYRKAIELDSTYAEILPVLILENCQELIKNHKDKKANKVVYLEIKSPEAKMTMKQPITVHQSIHPNLINNGVSEDLGKYFVLRIPNGRAWVDDARAHAIITESEEILIKYLFRQPNFSHGSELKSTPILEIEGTVAFLSARWGQNNYCHWMFDELAKIKLLFLAGIEMNSIDRFVVSSYQLPFHKDSLKAIGIPEEKIVESRVYPHIKAENLIVPSFTTARKWTCDFLRTEILPEKGGEKLSNYERIYISRRNASYRRVVNETEVLEFLDKWGFKNVTLESMSVAKQALLLAGAKVVVAPHGAGLTNLVFCKEGTKVIEFMAPDAVRKSYYEISNYCNLEYYYLIGESAEEINMSVSLDLLSKLLGLAGIC